MVSEAQGVSPAGGHSLIGQSQIDKTPRPQTPGCLLLCCVFTCLLFQSFSGIWHSLNGCGETPTASCSTGYFYLWIVKKMILPQVVLSI